MQNEIAGFIEILMEAVGAVLAAGLVNAKATAQYIKAKAPKAFYQELVMFS